MDGVNECGFYRFISLSIDDNRIVNKDGPENFKVNANQVDVTTTNTMLIVCCELLIKFSRIFIYSTQSLFTRMHLIHMIIDLCKIFKTYTCDSFV